MTFSLRLNEEEATLVRAYAELNNMSITDLFRQSVLSKIEDEFDLISYHEALAEYKADPVTYSHDEVLAMLVDES